MNTKKIAIVAVAVAIIVVAAATILILRNSNEEEIPEAPEGPYRMTEITLPLSTRLVVCGNADNNDVIDDADLKIVQDIVDLKADWDQNENPLADAYPDGVIDQNDIDLLKNIIHKNDCYVYYVDYKNQTVRVHYPIIDPKIGTTYYQPAQLVTMLGLWDNVIACGSGSLSEVSSPGWENLISYGKGYNVDPQTVVDSNVDTVVMYTQTDTTAPDMKDLVEATGVDINVLCINHEQLTRCVTTYGFLFDKEDITSEYLALADECSESVYDSLKDVKTEDQPSVALVMLYGTATTDKIRVLGYSETGSKHNLAVLFHDLPNVNWIRADSGTGAYGTYVGSEWFLDNQPDYIVLVGSSIGVTATDPTAEDYQKRYEEKCKEVFGETNAYKNGHIICTSNGLMNGYSNPLCSMKVLSYVYEQIDADLAQKAYDTWYNEYTLFEPEEKPGELIYVVGGS